uniref:Putative ovule protein n=1 Tax=Solanum chacoense TaxID=4108 RepID=A0A0V0HCI0_SOLCH
MKIIVLFGYFLLDREIYCCLLTLVFLNRAVCILISVHDAPPHPIPHRVYASTGITPWKLLVGI